MKYRVDLTNRAIRDLEHVYDRIDADDNAQARDWFNRLEQTILSLDEHPSRGRPRTKHCVKYFSVAGETSTASSTKSTIR